MRELFSAKIPCFMRAWLIAIAIFGVCLVAIRPWGNYPLNDDWQYARASKMFAESGKIRIDTPIAPALVGQIVLAYPIIRVFGMNHAFLRLLTCVMAAISLFCIDRILMVAGLPWSRRLLALTIVLFNPLFLYFSTTFMTELYGFTPALVAAAVYFECRGRAPSNYVCWSVVALLSVFAFWTRQFAGVVFPAIVITWFLTSRTRVKHRWFHTVLGCVVFAAGVAGYFFWVRASGNFGFAFGDPLARTMQFDKTAWKAETGSALVYLTGFFLPLLLLGVRGRWRDPASYVLGALCLLYAVLTRNWFQMHGASDLEFGGWTHRIFPYITNVIFRTGVGPVTLDDVYHQADMIRPHWAPHTWALIEWVLLGATFLWGFTLRRIWDVWTSRRDKTLRYEILLFGLIWSVFSWVITVQAYRLEIFDRYYFPVVLSFSILIPLLIPEGTETLEPSNRWVPIVSMICIAAIGWFTVAGLHDQFRWNDARWKLARFAFSQGVSPANLAGGFEINGWENYDNVQAHHGEMAPNCRVNYDDFLCVDATYRIGMNMIPGYEEWKQEPPSYWLATGPPVRLLRLTSGK